MFMVSYAFHSLVYFVLKAASCFLQSNPAKIIVLVKIKWHVSFPRE